MTAGEFRPDRREAIAVTAGVAALTLGMSTAALADVPATSLSFGRDQSFDNGWRFFRGAGEGYEQPALDDSNWRSVDLPHDWSIEDAPGGTVGPFDKKSKGGTATATLSVVKVGIAAISAPAACPPMRGSKCSSTASISTATSG